MDVVNRKELVLKRSLLHRRFNSWRLSRSLVGPSSSLPLPAPVKVNAQVGTDFLHTRLSVLHQHLQQTEGRFFYLSDEGHVGSALYELVVHERDRISPRKLADVEPSESELSAAGQPVEAVLDGSCALVREAAGAPQGRHMLVSLGRGDLAVLSMEGASAGQCSNTLLPLRPAPPLQGVRPFLVEAAYATAAGSIRAVLSAMRSKADGAAAAAAAPAAAGCDIFLVTLSPAAAAAAAAATTAACAPPRWQVTGVELLRRSSMVPHAVLPDPARDMLVLAYEPAPEPEGLPASMAPPHAGGSPRPAGSGRAAEPSAADEDADDADVDPRTLEQAAARLAAYTSAEPVGQLPQQQWTDIYKETGPLEGEAPEPACELEALMLESPAAAAAKETTAGAGTSGAAAHRRGVHSLWSMSCGASRVLAAGRGGGGSGGAPGGGLLLGLSDDVDCAVLSVTTVPLQPSTSAAASTDAQPPPVQVKHERSVPALAYIVAGKVQRKHLLLGDPGSSLAAVLVEGQKYAYIYKAVTQGEEGGEQQVLDLELGEGELVLGARLAPGSVRPGGSGAPPCALLLVLTRTRLLVHQLPLSW